MTTTSQNGKSQSSKPDGLKRMLDLEKRFQLSRMHDPTSAAITISSASTIQTQDSLPSTTLQPQGSVQTKITAGTSSRLSLSIPRSEISNTGIPRKYTLKDGRVVPQSTTDHDGSGSDRSSICHSPSWTDGGAKQRKKEREDAEMEKQRSKDQMMLDDDTKQTKKKKKRLTKRPPLNKQFAAMLTPVDPGSTTQTLVTTTTMEDDKRSSGSRSRRGSFESIRNFLRRPSRSSSQSAQTRERPPSRENGNFIGGLKLRMSEEAARPDISFSSLLTGSRKGRMVGQSSPSKAAKCTEPQIDISLPSLSQDPMQIPYVSIPERLANSLERRHSYQTQLGGDCENSKSIPDHDASIVRENIKKPQEGRIPLSDGILADFTALSKAASSSKPSKPTATQGKSAQNGKSLWPFHDEEVMRPQVTETKAPAVSQRVAAYVDSQRRQSKDISYVTGNERRTSGFLSPEFFPVDRSDSFRTARSHVSKDGNQRNSEQSNTLFSSFGGIHASAQSHLQDHRSPSDVILGHGSKVSKDLKDARGTSFHRESTSISLIDAECLNADVIEILRAPGRPDVVQTSITPSNNARRNHWRKPRPTDMTSSQEGLLTNLLPNRPQTSKSNKIEDPSPITTEQAHERKSSRRRPATDSSDEYSGLDESSNITTPIPSRPSSKEGNSSRPKFETSAQKIAEKSTKPASQAGKFPAYMSGALPYEGSESENGEHRRKGSSPRKSNDNEKSFPVPPASSISKCSSNAVQISKTEPDASSNTNHQHQLSSTRSAKRHDLPDFSFLPPLRHQTIRRSSDSPGHKSKIPVPTTEASISLSLTSSQRLRDARGNMSIPPNSNPSEHSVAKMLVECCTCHHFHDMPSRVYECMAKPMSMVQDRDRGVHGVVSSAVRCPWCAHGMTTGCCKGYAAIVILKERLH